MPRSGTVARATINFSKYQGLGNDFILVDNRHQEEPVVSSSQAVQLCDRHFGIGGDGVIFALPAADEDFTMRIFNSDGSEPEMCGNGIRCLAKFIADADGQSGGKYRIATGAGLIQPELLSDGLVRVDMGEPRLLASEIPTKLAGRAGDGAVVETEVEAAGKSFLVTTVSMGNPHAVSFRYADGSPIELDSFELAKHGPAMEGHPAYPAHANAEFVQVLTRDHVRMAVWERGAGPTLACGTGACATVVAGVLSGLVDRTATVDLPGGPLLIEWDEQTNKVFMTGPGTYVFSGCVEI